MCDGPARWRHGDLAEAHRRQVLIRGQRAANAAILGRSGGRCGDFGDRCWKRMLKRCTRILLNERNNPPLWRFGEMRKPIGVI